MKILVCITHVPDTTAKISFADGNTKFNNDGVQFIIGPYDDYALARAVEIKEAQGGEIVALHVGTAASEATIRKALAIGANDAVRINAQPRDAYFVATQIATIAKQNNYDLILTGRESIDYNGSQVAAMLGEMLDIPSVSIAKKLDIENGTATIDREIEGGKEVITAKLPIVAGASEGMAEPKIPNMRGIMSARTKPLQVVEPSDVPQYVTVNSYQTPPPRSTVKLVAATEVDKLVGLLHTEAKII